jgi:hypothetical protein
LATIPLFIAQEAPRLLDQFDTITGFHCSRPANLPYTVEVYANSSGIGIFFTGELQREDRVSLGLFAAPNPLSMTESFERPSLNQSSELIAGERGEVQAATTAGTGERECAPVGERQPEIAIMLGHGIDTLPAHEPVCILCATKHVAIDLDFREAILLTELPGCLLHTYSFFRPRLSAFNQR